MNIFDILVALIVCLLGLGFVTLGYMVGLNQGKSEGYLRGRAYNQLRAKHPVSGGE